MNNRHATRTGLSKKGVSDINRDVVIFTFFLFLSFIFWYLNSLGNEVEAEVWYPVKYTNLPRERVINNESQVKLNLYMKGSGTSILKLKLSGNKARVTIDMSKVSYKRVSGSKNLDYYIVTAGLTKSLGIQMRNGCEITSIKPDTLFFTLEKTPLSSGSGLTEKNGSVSRKK